MSHRFVDLRPLARTDLAAITPWFEDPDTRRYLGGPDWPATMLDLGERTIGEEFRGAIQTGAHHYLAEVDTVAVGYVDCGIFDRCTVYAGEGRDGPIIAEAIEAVTGSIAFVTAPRVRGRGIARAMVSAMLARPELDQVEMFEAGVEPDNLASRRCLEAAGFRVRAPEPDYEGMLYYRADRREDPDRQDDQDPSPAELTPRRGRRSTTARPDALRPESPQSRSTSTRP